MKILLTTLTSLVIFVSSPVMSHAGHSHISEEQAINSAVKSAKQMTFKDYGFSVGKLDSSWKTTSKQNVTASAQQNGYFLISVNNVTLDTTLYFKVAKTGEVIDVSKNTFNSSL